MRRWKLFRPNSSWAWQRLQPNKIRTLALEKTAILIGKYTLVNCNELQNDRNAYKKEVGKSACEGAIGASLLQMSHASYSASLPEETLKNVFPALTQTHSLSVASTWNSWNGWNASFVAFAFSRAKTAPKVDMF